MVMQRKKKKNCPNASLTHLRGRKNVRLRAVDPDGNFSTTGAELLEQSPIRADPQISLGYFHLESKTEMYSDSNWIC